MGQKKVYEHHPAKLSQNLFLLEAGARPSSSSLPSSRPSGEEDSREINDGGIRKDSAARASGKCLVR